jgi:hypothetical protein
MDDLYPSELFYLGLGLGFVLVLVVPITFHDGLFGSFRR